MNEVSAGIPGACASCVSRRAFLADAATIAALAALFAACGESPVEPLSKVEVKVGDIPGLATMNQLVLVDGNRAAKRTGSSSFVAFSRRCTHEGFTVDLSSSGFICQLHGSQFDSNGQVTQGPAGRALTSLATAYDPATDILTIG